ncbi:MAG: hypothetical protein ND807_18070, partial [Vicinamibacterales bacterium]|nr:hypothetical protein [Vicinamibacterales bacterium]
MINRIVRLTQLTLLMTTLVPSVVSAQTAGPVAEAKLDESLRESIQQGCVGTKSVIVRTQAGYRQGVRDTLTQHGDLVQGEFPALDAVAAEVHCDDLATLAGFASVTSVSVNAVVGAQTDLL